MAVLRHSDAKKLSSEERKTKLKELRIELIKGSTTANKAKAKTKEIKKAIARLLTLNNLNQEVSTKK